MAEAAEERLDPRTAELVERMQKQIEERSERALEHLRRAAADELAFRRAAMAPAAAAAPEALPLPPNTTFVQPVDPHSVATRSVQRISLPQPGPSHLPSPLPSPGQILCILSQYPPPYPSGGPLTPVTQYSAPPYHPSIIGRALAVPADGHLELAAQLFNDDTTATSTGGMVDRRLTAHLVTAFYQVPPKPKATTLHIAANVETDGSSLAMVRGGVGTAIGLALVRYDLRLSAFLVTQGAFVSAEATPVCRVWDGLTSETHDLATALSIDVPVAAWDLVGTAISAELTVGMSADSNLLVSSNFSSLSNWYQPPGQIRVPFVSLRYC